MLLDVFKNDAFHFTKLVQGINKLPHVPTKLGRDGLFEESGVPTLTVAFEMRDGVISLVQSKPRGAPGAAKNLERRKIIDVRTTHLPQRVSVMADEVIALREFGTEQDVKTAMSLLMEKTQVARTDLSVTHEWQRMGALRGKVLDADGSELYNFHSLFGVPKTTFNFDLTNDATDVRTKCQQYKRAIENKMGGLMMTGLDLECSPEFMDELLNHPDVKLQFQAQEGRENRADKRDGFEYGGIFFSEYRGQIGSSRFIPAGIAIPVPRGVPGLLKTYFSPANYMEAVGQPGLPFYMKSQSMDFDVGVEWDVQSNPLHVCTRPDVIVEAGMNAASITAANP